MRQMVYIIQSIKSSDRIKRIADKNGLAIIDFRDHLNIKFSLMVESRYTGLRAFMYFEKYVFKEHSFSFLKSNPE